MTGIDWKTTRDKLTAFDLRAALAPVWRGDRYYAKREPGPEPVVDPDGRTRDLRSEAEADRWVVERSETLDWLPQKASVYDLGCGDGKLKRARPDLRVYGYDPKPELQRLALMRGCVCVWEDVPGPERMTSPMPCELFDDSPLVDALWCCNAVEHMADPWTVLESALGLVKPGGIVIVETPDFGSPVAMEWGSRYRLLQDPTHISLFTAEGLVRMLRDLGVEVQEVAWPGYFGTPLQDRRSELYRDMTQSERELVIAMDLGDHHISPPAPGNIVAVRGRKL